MKRRQVEQHLEPPARLRSYDSADWPGDDPLRQWKAGRKVYAELHGWGSGDALDELIDRVQILRRLAGP